MSELCAICGVPVDPETAHVDGTRYYCDHHCPTCTQERTDALAEQ